MRIAVVDDNDKDRGYFARALERGQNADVLAVGSIEDNIQQIADHAPELLLVDDRLGPLSSAEDSLRTISEKWGNLPTIVMSSDVSPMRRAELVRMGAVECVEKDTLDADALNLVVAMASQRNSVLKPRSPEPSPVPAYEFSDTLS